MASVYKGQWYCDKCTKHLKALLALEYPEKVKSENPNDFPQWVDNYAYVSKPRHCAHNKYCIEAIRLPSGEKVGEVLGKLTTTGIRYVLALRDSGEEKEIANFWIEYYPEIGEYEEKIVYM